MVFNIIGSNYYVSLDPPAPAAVIAPADLRFEPSVLQFPTEWPSDRELPPPESSRGGRNRILEIRHGVAVMDQSPLSFDLVSVGLG